MSARLLVPSRAADTVVEENGKKSHVIYTVTTEVGCCRFCAAFFFAAPPNPTTARVQTNFKDYPGTGTKEFVVTRRYKDFAWLKNVLNDKLDKEKEGGTIGEPRRGAIELL